MATTQAPDSNGIKVGMRQAPGGVADGDIIPVGLLEDLPTIVDKSRTVKRYTPINNTDYEEVVAAGVSSDASSSMDVLYDPEGSEGVNEIDLAYEENSLIELTIEAPNKKTADGNGTTYTQLAKVSSFKIVPEKDGKFKASFSIEKIGKAIVTAAA